MCDADGTYFYNMKMSQSTFFLFHCHLIFCKSYDETRKGGHNLRQEYIGNVNKRQLRKKISIIKYLFSRFLIGY